MKLVNGIFALAIATLLAGCGGKGGPIDQLNRVQPVGSPFNTYLAEAYRTLAKSLHGSDAVHFARKGMAVANGMTVEPEVLIGRDLRGKETAEMAEGRSELIAALDAGGRDWAPDVASVAQSRFDCWVTLKQRFPGEDISCRERFISALFHLNALRKNAEPPVMPPPPAETPVQEFPPPIIEASQGADVPLQEASLLVFFDWNKYSISDSANGVLDTVAREIKSRHDIKRIIVRGYTDTSGPEGYNKKLSLRRADAVRAGLIARGIPAKKIKAEGRGETEPLVATPDNVREAKNRRAQITFE